MQVKKNGNTVIIIRKQWEDITLCIECGVYVEKKNIRCELCKSEKKKRYLVGYNQNNRKKRVVAMKSRRDMLIEAGLCSSCGREKEEERNDKTQCVKCSKKLNEKMGGIKQQRLSNGCCIICGCIMTGYELRKNKSCYKCRLRGREYANKSRRRRKEEGGNREGENLDKNKKIV